MQLYAPTADQKYDDDIERLYDLSRKVLGKLGNDDVNLKMSDYNVKIGPGRRLDLVGNFGLGRTTTEATDYLISTK